MTMRLLLCLLLAASGAQVYDHALNEQELQRILPVLRADVAAADERSREEAARKTLEAARATAREQAAGEIARGADPLEWLRARSRDVAAPSTATYNAACSRALTAADKRPSTVFSFGIPAPSGWLFVWKERDPSALVPPPSSSSRQGGAPASATRAETIAQQTRSFYSARSFEYEGEGVPFEWRLVAPDKRISATVMGVNVLGRLEPCRALANGPAIVVRADDELFAKTPSQGPAVAGAVPAQQGFDAAFDKAGMSQAEYLNLKLQLLAARRDAADEDAGRAIGGRDASESAIRRQNASFYRQRRDLLDPILSRLASVAQ